MDQDKNRLRFPYVHLLLRSYVSGPIISTRTRSAAAACACACACACRPKHGYPPPLTACDRCLRVHVRTHVHHAGRCPATTPRRGARRGDCTRW
jgi:hypothetical protein